MLQYSPWNSKRVKGPQGKIISEMERFCASGVENLFTCHRFLATYG